MKRGRDFSAHDIADSQRVTIIDESLARQFWPSYPRGDDPVGKRLFIGGVNPKAAEIVGIVADVRQGLEGNVWPGTVYLPFTQGSPQSAMFVIRVDGDPLRFTRAVREQVRALDPDQAIANVRTMETLVETQVGQRYLLMILLESFAVVALLLALTGIYGVIAYSVSQRTQEMGIRRALGASQGDILWLVIGQGFVLMLAGIALGLGGALAVTRVAKTLLFHVSATDPATFAGIAVLFLLVSLAASYIPARRAARIDPMAALRG
jgi:putative ABC transport system permease protein